MNPWILTHLNYFNFYKKSTPADYTSDTALQACMNSSLANAHQSEEGNQATHCEMLTLLLVSMPYGSRSWHCSSALGPGNSFAQAQCCLQK